MKSMMSSRRKALKQIAAGCLAMGMPKLLFSQTGQIMKRAIPSTGEKVGVVGLGTWQTFDVGSSEASREPLKAVLKALVADGGNVVDSSPMYGSSEQVVGDLSDELGIGKDLFYATKVWTTGRQSGINQMNASMRKMKASPMDLMQIHNLQDWKTHIKTLYDWKDKGLIRYIGITHYVDSAHDDLERIIKSESIDFLQVNYSINDRNAEKSLLPAAKDNGVAVLTNRPYSGGSLFRKTKGQELPGWAAEFDCQSWGQFFLKYLLANDAVTCVIPGTSKPHHMKDNLKAGLGKLPTEDHRKKMRELMS
ncbi:aldo/keto reductase [Ekhidna sp.]|uniref:aldo/keto reductase n=1 Tax=Ekhidna sp. TaxID=2608089 RepID=UPI003C7EBD27